MFLLLIIKSDMFFCMIGGTYQRCAFHLFEPFLQSCFFINSKLFRSNVCCNREVFVGWLQILPDGEDFATDGNQVVH